MKEETFKQKNTIIGHRIKQLRLKEGYTQNYIAELLSVSSQHYGTLERGVNPCPLDTIMKICDIYEVPITSILSGLDNIDRKYMDHVKGLVEDINNLSQDYKEIVENVVKYLKEKDQINCRKKKSKKQTKYS